MGMPCAVIGDMTVCPMQTPNTPPVPHVGGPIMATCATVLVGGRPAATMGDMAICVGPPDSCVKGSATVLFGGKPVVRVGDTTAHGGTVTGPGVATVLIGG